MCCFSGEEGRTRGLEEFSVIENKDVSIQVQHTVSDLAVQYDAPEDENISKTSVSYNSRNLFTGKKLASVLKWQTQDFIEDRNASLLVKVVF